MDPNKNRKWSRILEPKNEAEHMEPKTEPKNAPQTRKTQRPGAACPHGPALFVAPMFFLVCVFCLVVSATLCKAAAWRTFMIKDLPKIRSIMRKREPGRSPRPRKICLLHHVGSQSQVGLRVFLSLSKICLLHDLRGHVVRLPPSGAGFTGGSMWAANRRGHPMFFSCIFCSATCWQFVDLCVHNIHVLRTAPPSLSVFY